MRQSLLFRYAAALVLIFGLLLTLSFSWMTKQKIELNAINVASGEYDRIAAKVSDRLLANMMVLKGGAGLFAVSNSVTRTQWKRYTDSLDIANNLPGTQGVGFSLAVTSRQLNSHIAAIRAEGFPEYTVRTSGQFEMHSPIIFIEPFAGRNLKAFGFDMYSEATRRDALVRAQDTGLTSLSGKVKLVQESGGKEQAGILMYTPVYANGAKISSIEQRRSALLGWVYSPYRMDDLLKGILMGYGDSATSSLNFHVYDGDEEKVDALLFDSSPEIHPDRRSVLYQHRSLNFNGHNWLLTFDANSNTQRIKYFAAWIVLAAGTLLSFLLFILLKALTNMRINAKFLADELTHEIRLRETTLIESEAAAHHSLEALRLQKYALDQHAIVATTDVHGSITYANDLFCNISGYSREELLGQDHKLLNSGHHPHGFFKAMYKTIARGEVWTAEVCNRAKDGSLYWVDTTVVPFMGADGKPEQYIAIRADITERKENLAELEKYRHDLEELVMHRTDALQSNLKLLQTALHDLEQQKFVLDEHAIVSMADIKGRITYANDRFCQISGYTRTELLGQDHRILNSALHHKGFWQEMYETVNQGETWHGEVCNRAKDGSLYWVSSTIVKFIGENDNPDEYIAIRTDITQRKLAEQAADAANRAKSGFLANMSHEIRTPMNGVVGMVDILQETQLNQKQQGMVNTIRTSSLALLGILNDILDYSKIEAGQLSVEVIPTCLREIAEEVAQLMITPAGAKAVELSIFVSPTLPRWILTDSLRLRQILLNLLGNAIKFTSTKDNRVGNVLMRIEAGTATDGTPVVAIRIIDNGIGMSPTTLDRLFTPFSQADESTARKFGGTGLGLSISSRLVDLMGGKITVHSTLGQGSEFVVELPLVEAVSDRDLTEDPNLSGLTVLFVTSNALASEIVSSYCAAAGAKTVVVDSAAAAQQQLALAAISPAVLLIGLSTTVEAGDIKRPANVGLVRFVRRDVANHADDEILIQSRPVLYNELLQGLAIASGRLTPVDYAALADHRQATRVHAPTVEEARQKGQLILLAEDNETNRVVIQEQLRLLGYASEVAEDGVQALAMWQQGRYALLLTDCNMPNMDGFELTAAIRKLVQQGSHFPIIAVTANAMSDESENCIKAGMDDYLSKPLRLAILGEKLSKWLPVSGVAQEIVHSTPSTEVEDTIVAVHAIWEASQLTQLMGDNPSMHRRVLEKFLATAQEQVAAIDAAIQSGETGIAGDMGHKLKSAARSVGAINLAELCQEMESLARHSEKDNLEGANSHKKICARIKQSFAAAEEAINNHLGR